jgi:acyl-lipid omega-6 desaturase (Delta-12 desaturase)
MSNASKSVSPAGPQSWQALVAPYQQAHLWRSVWEVANTFVPFFFCWYLAYRALAISYGLTLAISALAAGFLIRIFIILHDCGHGSFFKSMRANDWVGVVSGIVTVTPYFQWRHDHALHHAGSGDLDRRGVGDVWTLTVSEYLALPRLRRLAYRAYRHPLVMFGLGPIYLFAIAHRFVAATSTGRRERQGVYLTNLAALAIVLLLAWLIGWQALLLVHLPILFISSTAGVWLFYVQHQFEDTYWENHPDWKYAIAALQGSSYYKLPKVLQWFTGNIGLHHIHHLSPKIPNYNLQRCYDANPLLRQVTVVTFWESLKTMGLKLWDEDRKTLVGFRGLKRAAVPADTAP